MWEFTFPDPLLPYSHWQFLCLSFGNSNDSRFSTNCFEMDRRRTGGQEAMIKGVFKDYSYLWTIPCMFYDHPYISQYWQYIRSKICLPCRNLLANKEENRTRELQCNIWKMAMPVCLDFVLGTEFWGELLSYFEVFSACSCWDYLYFSASNSKLSTVNLLIYWWKFVYMCINI